MEIRLLEKKNGKLSFVLKNAHVSLANSLRRTILEEVPTMAIEDVEIRKNDSVMYDEVLAHRLGLIPLTTDLKSYTLPAKCKCEGEGCARCQCKLTLKVKGPAMVYASDLKSKDSGIKPVYPKMPLVRLLKNQHLELEATAVLGQGKVHMKWSPGHAHYNYEPKITVKHDPQKLSEVGDNYPPQIFGEDGKIDRNLINTPALVDACDGVCDDLVKVERIDNSFVFNVESFGQLEPKKMVQEAVKIFQEQIEEFTDQIKELK